MAITDIEEEVLRQVDEDLTSEYNWDGSEGLREAIADAIDELCFFGDFFERNVMIPLKEDVAFYEISPDNAQPLYVKGVRLWETDRRLDPESLIGLSEKNAQWMIGRGSPFNYIPLSSNLIGFYPCPSEDGDSAELRCVCCPDHYGEGEFVTIREELEEALIHYGKYFLMLREGSMFNEALNEYKDYLRFGGMTNELKHHSQGMRRYLYGSEARK